MAKNPVLFPDAFSTSASSLDVGVFGEPGATTAWVKQLIVEMFYGRDVPLFSFKDNEISWGDGFSYFDGTVHPVQKGSHSFQSLDTGWYYVYVAQQGNTTSLVTVSGSPPNLASQQLWWNVKVESGLITEVIPAKVGFGV